MAGIFSNVIYTTKKDEYHNGKLYLTYQHKGAKIVKIFRDISDIIIGVSKNLSYFSHRYTYNQKQLFRCMIDCDNQPCSVRTGRFVLYGCYQPPLPGSEVVSGAVAAGVSEASGIGQPVPSIPLPYSSPCAGQLSLRSKTPSQSAS